MNNSLNPAIESGANSDGARRALICGVGGQDGAYLAKFLLEKGYVVSGTSRDATMVSRSGLEYLGIADKVSIVSMAGNDFRSVLQALTRTLPDEIYNLAGQSSVGLSFEQPVEAIESIALGTLNLLEAIRFTGRNIRFYNAGSSECFGDTGKQAANESTPFIPRSPYAVAKVCSHNLVANYRSAYQMFACTGILFNHESPLRPERFVTQKIVRAANRIASGSTETLVLGNLDICRDWGWAPDYVEAMWLMLQTVEPEDFVIATGETVSLQYFVETVFSHYGLNWGESVNIDPTLFRPSDLSYSAADPFKASVQLGWKAKHSVSDVINRMCTAV
jgi:GDPmannose 4,6-dehydratase